MRDADISDAQLLTAMLAGDEAALRALMNRYDRLVRYTVFRMSARDCHRDPLWLDSVASETWSGFVRSVGRAPDRLPHSVSTYLIQIARNQSIEALRRRPRASAEHDDSAQTDMRADPGAAPQELAAKIELLTSLNQCLSDLSESDRLLAAQLPAITERRWRDAAAALGISESTLRSRWKNVLISLRRCMERSGKSFAPDDFLPDS